MSAEARERVARALSAWVASLERGGGVGVAVYRAGAVVLVWEAGASAQGEQIAACVAGVSASGLGEREIAACVAWMAGARRGDAGEGSARAVMAARCARAAGEGAVREFEEVERALAAAGMAVCGGGSYELASGARCATLLAAGRARGGSDAVVWMACAGG